MKQEQHCHYHHLSHFDCATKMQLRIIAFKKIMKVHPQQEWNFSTFSRDLENTLVMWWVSEGIIFSLNTVEEQEDLLELHASASDSLWINQQTGDWIGILLLSLSYDSWSLSIRQSSLDFFSFICGNWNSASTLCFEVLEEDCNLMPDNVPPPPPCAPFLEAIFFEVGSSSCTWELLK